MTLTSLLATVIRFEPILLTIILAAIRPNWRRVVPVLTILIDLALFGFILIKVRGSSGYGSGYMTLYPFVCLAILFLGLIIESVFRAATKRFSTGTCKEIDTSELRGRLAIGDRAAIFLVVANTVALLAPKATGHVALCFLVFMSTSRLIGTSNRWIVAALLIEGFSLLLDLSLFLLSSTTFQDLTGLRRLHNSIPLSWFGPYRWFGGLANVIFGVAVLNLCKQIKTLTSGVTERR